jgi:GNAT superfamily N-acetyltransferase
MTTTVRIADDHELDAYVAVWNAITPDEPVGAGEQRERRERNPRRLYLIAESGGAVVGCGFAGPSQSEGRGFVSPRVLPGARRTGVGTALLGRLVEHIAGLGATSVSAHVDGDDPGSLAFGSRFGFEEVDRQVEQVIALAEALPAPSPPPGVRIATLADRPELLHASYPLATEGYADMATFSPVTITLDDWLAGDDASLPEGSLVALAGDEIVGFSGLCRTSAGAVEDGLTVVRRDWRRRGLAEALKRAKLAWASGSGIREITTWTQTGNEAMRALNERLGYAYRSVSITVRADLPLR